MHGMSEAARLQPTQSSQPTFGPGIASVRGKGISECHGAEDADGGQRWEGGGCDGGLCWRWMEEGWKQVLEEVKVGS